MSADERDFVEWLRAELERRGWSRSEAARRGGVSASMYDKVINRRANPGLEFLVGVARAFGISREEVFRRAGILPPIDVAPGSGKQLLHWYARCDGEQQACLLAMARLLAGEAGGEQGKVH